MIRTLFFLFLSFSLQAQFVYKTPKGEKYHLETCRMVENVSERITLAKAAEQGLESCKICKPAIAPAAGLLQQKNKEKGESQTVQCSGTTKAGTRCKHKTSIGNGYCFQHNPDK